MHGLSPRRLLALAVMMLALAVSGAPAGAVAMHAPAADDAMAGHAMEKAHADPACHDKAADAGDEDDCCGDRCDGCACTACFTAADSLAAAMDELRLDSALRHPMAAAIYTARAPEVPRSPPKRLS